jgi:cell division protein FtsI (penicillin-binding protein 3)
MNLPKKILSKVSWPWPKDPERTRLTVVMVVVLCFASLIVARAAFLQLRPDAKLEAMARRQFESRVLMRPPRGPILDRNGEPLAVNIEVSSLAANPSKIVEKRALARLLSRVIDMSYARILIKLHEKREFVWIKRHLNEAALSRLKNLPDGLWLIKESKRVYPHGELAAHVLGDVNVDSEGVEGVELWFNDRLKGKVAAVKAIKDALGRPAFIDALAATQAQDGEPVTLTIDASLQFAVEEELKAAVRRTSARGGSVIVMNAVNGEILALANEPAFNPNEPALPSDRRRNRVLTDGYEPGSTIKPLLLAGALSHGWKLSDSVYGEKGSFQIQGKTISEAEAREKFEWITLKRIIQVSSNIGAAKLALKLGPERYQDTLRAFGIGQKTDVGFPGETSGNLPSKRAWQPLTTANIGFGQGVLTTPIQMMRAYATFLNGGWLVQPILIKTPDRTSRLKLDAPKRLLSPRVTAQVLEALESVTEDGGTGVKAALEGYRVAGKTGTAQTIDPVTHAYSRSRYISSFIGFPLGVEPRVVIFTSIDEPHGVYYASETAAPLFREVLNAVASRFGIPAKVDARKLASDKITVTHAHPTGMAMTMPMPMATAPAVRGLLTGPPASPDAPPAGALDWEGMTRDGTSIYRMPRLIGLDPREALQALKGHGFQVELRGTGVVQAQSPEDGRPVAEGERVRLTLVEP